MTAFSSGAGRAAASFVAFGKTSDLADQAIFAAALRRFFRDLRIAGNAHEFAAMVERAWSNCERARQIAASMRAPADEGAKIVALDGH